MEMSKEMLRLRCGYGVLTSRSNRGEMHAEQSPDPSIEIHFASLDSRPEQCALTYFQDFSD